MEAKGEELFTGPELAVIEIVSRLGGKACPHYHVLFWVTGDQHDLFISGIPTDAYSE